MTDVVTTVARPEEEGIPEGFEVVGVGEEIVEIHQGEGVGVRRERIVEKTDERIDEEDRQERPDGDITQKPAHVGPQPGAGPDVRRYSTSLRFHIEPLGSWLPYPRLPTPGSRLCLRLESPARVLAEKETKTRSPMAYGLWSRGFLNIHPERYTASDIDVIADRVADEGRETDLPGNAVDVLARGLRFSDGSGFRADADHAPVPLADPGVAFAGEVPRDGLDPRPALVADLFPDPARDEVVDPDEIRHKGIGGPFVKVPRGAELLDHSPVDDGDAVREGEGFLLVVGHVDGGYGEFFLELSDFGTHLEADLGVEIAEGFIEEQHVRVQGPGHGPGRRAAADRRRAGRDTGPRALPGSPGRGPGRPCP